MSRCQHRHRASNLQLGLGAFSLIFEFWISVSRHASVRLSTTNKMRPRRVRTKIRHPIRHANSKCDLVVYVILTALCNFEISKFKLRPRVSSRELWTGEARDRDGVAVWTQGEKHKLDGTKKRSAELMAQIRSDTPSVEFFKHFTRQYQILI